MTKITANKKEYPGKTILYMSAKDHAEASALVCAGISAIMYALAGFVVNEMGTPNCKITLESGYAKVCCEMTERTMAAFETALIGLIQISLSYPEEMKINQDIWA